MIASIRSAYIAWKEAAATRSARGELRASREERETLERFVSLLDQASPELREEWAAVRAGLDAAGDADCVCGHPLAHHDADGSCFHVVGCATGCGCVEREHVRRR